MRIYFRDETGLRMVEVDKYGIIFLEGVAMFSTEGAEFYTVDAKNIEMIESED